MTSHNVDNEKEELTVRHSDFSIEHILTRAGSSGNSSKFDPHRTGEKITLQNAMDSFSWLQCTRYCPPKVPRIQRKEGAQKRQLGRHPRIPFSSHQLSILENKFKESAYLSSEEVIKLSKELQLADIRVKIWFQNRRARERRETNCLLVNADPQKSQETIKFVENKFTNNRNRIDEQELKIPIDFSNKSVSLDAATSFSSSSHNKTDFLSGSSNNHTFIPILLPFVTLNNSLIPKEERR